MKKLYFNLLCLLFVIFIIYCFTRKEGFLTIDASQMCVTDAAGAITCDGSTINDEGTVGQQGHLCALPANHTGYIINTGDSDYNMYSGTGFNPGSSFACDVDYERADANIPPVAIPCNAHNGEIILNGCISKCQIDNALSGQYGGVTLPPNISDGTTPLPGVTCGSDLIPATNKCYQRDGTINTAITTEAACSADSSENTWFNSGDLQAVCHNRSDISSVRPVEDYKIIGCEEGCLTRNSGNHKQDYITAPEPGSIAATRGENREVIYINDLAIPATQDPYDVSGENVLAAGATFDVTATCGTVTGSDGTSVPFSEPFGSVVTEACNLDTTSQGSAHLESRRYSVRGCYPTCSEADERCINMSFSYTDAQNTPAPDLTEFKENLLTRYMANDTGTALTGGEQQQFKDQIYYYRKYRHNGQDHIEAQFKCADAECQFAAASIDAASFEMTSSAQTIRAVEMGLPRDGDYELCLKNHRVQDGACVPCTGLPNTPEAELNEAGDDPLGGDTTCLPECGRTPETTWTSWSGATPTNPTGTGQVGLYDGTGGGVDSYTTWSGWPSGQPGARFRTCLCPETVGTDIFSSLQPDHQVRAETSGNAERCHTAPTAAGF